MTVGGARRQNNSANARSASPSQIPPIMQAFSPLQSLREGGLLPALPYAGAADQPGRVGLPISQLVTRPGSWLWPCPGNCFEWKPLTPFFDYVRVRVLGPP